MKMGSSQSSDTRKLSVENENTIQVSKAALDRIQAQIPKPEPIYNEPPSYQNQKRYEEYASDEAYWTKRIESLQRAHDTINTRMQTEYRTALEKTNELFKKTTDDTIAGKTPPCREESAKVLKCYKENKTQSLACSKLVNSFNNCVLNSRFPALSTTH